MPPLDPSIILGLKPAVIPQKDPLEQYGKVMTLRHLLSQTDAEDLKMDALRQSHSDDAAVRRINILHGMEPEKLPAAYREAGLVKQADLAEKNINDRDLTRSNIAKNTATAGKENFEISEKRLGALRQAGQGALEAYDGLVKNGLPPALASAQVQSLWESTGLQLAQTGLFNSKEHGAILSGFTKPFNPAEVRAGVITTMKRAELLADARAREQQAEVGRHNRETEGNAAGQLGVARDRLKFDQDQPKGSIHQTNEGTFIINPRDGTSQQVMGPDDKPLGGKALKDIPQSVLTGMMENNRSLNKIDQALAAIGGNSAGVPKGMIADKAATGVKGYLPNFALNRVDPSGTDTRALIADIGSLKIHERSGAAVTASESPRLMPFIPLATDDAATIAKKLNNFKREYELVQQETGNYYNADNGFKPYKPATMQTQGSAAPAKKLQVNPAKLSDAELRRELGIP